MKARDKATIEADRVKVWDDLAAIKREEADLRVALKGVEQRRSAYLAWGVDVPRDLDNELADADLVIVDGGPHDDYVIVGLTRAQATVRRYGSGRHGNETIIRAGSKYAPVSLEQCRAAWVAAGRVLP